MWNRLNITLMAITVVVLTSPEVPGNIFSPLASGSGNEPITVWCTTTKLCLFHHLNLLFIILTIMIQVRYAYRCYAPMGHIGWDSRPCWWMRQSQKGLRNFNSGYIDKPCCSATRVLRSENVLYHVGRQ